MIYTSLNNEKIKEIKKLNIKKYREIENLFIVEGEHLVLEAYKKGVLKTLIVEENTSFNLDVETMIVTREVIKHITELETPQNIIGICNKLTEEKIGNKVLVLDDIQDPGNLGAIIRSAVAFNIDTIVISNNTVDLYNSKVVRASQGMLFNINIIRKDIKEIILNLKKENYKILATRVTSGKSLKSIVKTNKFAIIMGNEGNGVSKDILDLSDEYLYIDINKNCESLNVAVATSIILYELDK